MTQAPVLKFYDVTKPVTLSVDASLNGLGAVLLQDGQPIAYASKALTAAEKNYAQIEKETLAITFGVERFHHYVYGKKIMVESDHKPLEVIFKKPLNNAPPRIQRLLLRLQKYDISVYYKPGNELHIADTLSRAFLSETDVKQQEADDFLIHALSEEEIEAQVNLLVSNLAVSEQKLKEFKEATMNDIQLQDLKRICLTGWPENKRDVPNCINSFWTFKEEIHFANGLLFKGPRIIVPEKLRNDMLKRLHETHLGIQKSKERARECLHWPGMSKDIEDYISNCSECLKHRNNNSKEPLQVHNVPERPWEKIGTDIFEYNNKYYCIAVDYYSKYPEIALLENMKSVTVITHLKSIFARHGIPDTVFSDNGPAYASKEFKQFASDWEFKHETSSPGYPQSNGMVERTIQTVKQMLKKTADPYLGLLELRNALISEVNSSPAQLLMSRRLKSKLPTSSSLLIPKTQNVKNVRIKLQAKQEKGKQYFDKTSKPLKKLKKNETIRMRYNNCWKPATVIKQSGQPRSYVVQSKDGGIYRRNRRHLLQTNEPAITRYYDSDTDEANFQRQEPHADPNEPNENQGYRAPRNVNIPYTTQRGRVVRKPTRLIEQC